MLKQLVSDPSHPGSLAHGARLRRWDELRRRFPDLGAMRVLDLGGTPSAWRVSPVRPAHVVTVNLDPGTAHHDEPHLTSIVGDACRLPESLRRERFDLVYSNSLMEHIGGHQRRRLFAEAVLAAAPHHWVQTPYRYFPIEPHWVFPGMQWLPFPARVAVSRRWPYGHIERGDRAKAVADVAEVELQSATQMRSYFPASHLWFERFAGLPKSLVAIG
jgi:hypothetical protein